MTSRPPPPESPTSQAVTPTDEKLEKLLDEFAKRAIEWDSPDPEGDPSYEELARDRYVAARAALVEYLSEDTQRLDWLENRVHGTGEALREAIDDARRASMKERPE